MIRVKRIGQILPDGVVEGYSPEPEVQDAQKVKVYKHIAYAGRIKHTLLLRKHQRNLNAAEFAMCIRGLIQAGLIESKVEGRATYYYAIDPKIKDIHQKEELYSQNQALIEDVNREKEKRLILSEEQLSTQKIRTTNLHNNIWAYRDTIVQVFTDEYYYPENEIVLEIKRYVFSIEKKVMALEAEVFALEGLEKDKGRRREGIPDDVRIFVWRRDEGRCVEC